MEWTKINDYIETLEFEGHEYEIQDHGGLGYVIARGMIQLKGATLLDDARAVAYLDMCKVLLGEQYEGVLDRMIEKCPEVWDDKYEYVVLFEAGFLGLYDPLLGAILDEAKRLKGKRNAS